MTLTCSRCYRDTSLLADGICLDCATQIEDERAIRADAEIVRWAAEDALDFISKSPLR